uniref:MENTAL domain-containing protein n=1 Tax=Panagrolaimus sp. PS1159 TaxID=55785 RepID=A0AC35F663_9BILA
MSSQQNINNNNRGRYVNRGIPSVNDPLLYDENPMSKDRQKFLIICVFDFALATLLWLLSTVTKDRQKFLIICVFDFALATLLWLLSTVTKGDDWPKIFMQEINLFEKHFLQTSLFDIIIVVFLRMIVLLICFAWLRLDHWLPVAITTTITTIYIIIKILFFFNKDNGALPQYLMIIGSFIIAWIELWLLPFRVLAHERSNDIVSIETPPTEATLRSNDIVSIETPPTEATLVRSIHEEDFRSAVEYSTDEESRPPVRSATPLSKQYIKLSSEMRNECFNIAERTEANAREIYNEIDTWKQLNSVPEVRYSDRLNSFYIKKLYHCLPKSLFIAMWKENIAWNTQAKSSQILLPLDSETELVRSISQPAMNGYIASRDFIDIKKVNFDKESNTYFCTYSSVGPTISQKVPTIDGLV